MTPTQHRALALLQDGFAHEVGPDALVSARTARQLEALGLVLYAPGSGSRGGWVKARCGAFPMQPNTPEPLDTDT